MVTNFIIARLVERPSLILLIQLFIEPEKETNGLHLSIVCSGYTLRKSAEIVEVTWVTLFYWRHKLLSALKQIDFENFERIVEVDEPISYTLKMVSVAFPTESLVSVEESLNTEVLVTNRYLYLLPQTEQKQLSPKSLVWAES